MRMLLNHTSGLPFDSPCLSEDDTTLKDCAQEIANTGLNFIPGNRFGYSGAGYQVAGYVATVVSGKSWSTLVNERLAGPLGMNSLTYGDRKSGVSGKSVSVRVVFGGRRLSKKKKQQT